MTFWPAHKAMRSIAAGQNVAEKNRTKAKGRLRFFVARAANGGEAYTDLLGEVRPVLHFLIFFLHILLLNAFYRL
jgi:hypothetical protein